MTPTEKVLMLYGDAWVWTAFAPEWRLVPAFVVGKRVQENADLLIERLKAMSLQMAEKLEDEELRPTILRWIEVTQQLGEIGRQLGRIKDECCTL